MKNMVKLVLKHKQTDNVKSSNLKELHYFSKYDFDAFIFDAAYDYHNSLNVCIYCHFNCVLMTFTDIICICPDLFSCSRQYAQNVAKSSNT